MLTLLGQFLTTTAASHWARRGTFNMATTAAADAATYSDGTTRYRQEIQNEPVGWGARRRCRRPRRDRRWQWPLAAAAVFDDSVAAAAETTMAVDRRGHTAG